MLVKNLMPYRFAAYAADDDALLEVIYILGKCTCVLLFCYTAYFSKIVFAYKVVYFFFKSLTLVHPPFWKVHLNTSETSFVFKRSS